jgi:hypothetical protein
MPEPTGGRKRTGRARISRRTLLKALGTAAVSVRVPAAMAQSAAVIGGGFDALVAAMKPGTWRKINRNRPHEIALRRTKANFDGGAHAGLPDTWPSDAAVAESGYSGGVGPATGVYAFSKHTFDPLTGRAFHMGGGHAATHDNTIFRFDPGSGLWSIAHKSGRLYPARGNLPPAWSHQMIPQQRERSDYWVDVNAAGQPMPSATHTYGTCLWEDGGDRAYISGTYGEISGSGNLGSCWVWDSSNNALREHWYDPTDWRTNAGFSHNDGIGLDPIAYAPETGFLYRYAPFKVYRIADPWNAPRESLLASNGALHNYCGHHIDMVSFIDDTAGGAISLFQHYRDSDPRTQWQYIRAVDRWPTIQQGVYERADPVAIFRKGTVDARGFCRSLAGNTIVCWDRGPDLYEFRPANPFSETRIVRITERPAGDLPPAQTTAYCRIERLPRHGAYICGADGDVWVYKA